MKTANFRRGLGWLSLCLMCGAIGCQTWVPESGLTLPTPRYLDHPAQYLPPSPPFSLPRELDTMQRQRAAIGPQLGQPEAIAPGQ